MAEAIAELKVFEDHHKKENWLNDPLSDVFLMFQGNIFPLHLSVIRNSDYLTQIQTPGSSMIFIQQNLHVTSLLKVLRCLYGYPLIFDRGTEFADVFEVAIFLKVQTLVQALLKDIEFYFQEYGIFTLYNVAIKYNLVWLRNKCLDQFMEMKYEQMLIQKFDLLSTDQQAFIQILRHHQMLKEKGVGLVLSRLQINKIIEEYSNTNSVVLSADDILSSTVCEDERSDFITWSNNTGKSQSNRRRKLTWNCSRNSIKLLQDDIANEQKKRKKTQCIKYFSQFEDQVLFVMDLKHKNREMKHSSRQIEQEIGQVWGKLETIEQEQLKTEGMITKMEQMQKQSKMQDIRLKNLEATANMLLRKTRK